MELSASAPPSSTAAPPANPRQLSASRSSNEEAVLITGPTLTEDRGITFVQAERCENVSLWSSSATTTTPTMLLQKLACKIGIHQMPEAEEKELDELGPYSSRSPAQPAKNSSGSSRTGTDHLASLLDLQDDHTNATTPSTPLHQHYFNDTLPLDQEEERTTKKRTAPPTYVLGVRYDTLKDFDARREDESYLFWFTYRCDFPAIQPYGITSDAGWGCMLRAAQMLLAQALRLHYNGRDWKPLYWTDPFVQSIYTWFADFPSTNECFYSLHNMVATGMAKYDKLPGEWFGPSTASFVLRDLVQLHAQKIDSLFRVHVASGGTVFRDELADAASYHHQGSSSSMSEHCPPPELSHPLENVWQDELIGHQPWNHSLLLLIPLRLGLRSFHKDYVDLLAHTFSFPQSVGVLGGRPRGAHWFYGSVGTKVLALDPHTVQAAPKLKKKQIDISDVDYQQSLFSKYPQVCAIASLDPTIALGFYCKDQNDFEDIFRRLQAYAKEHPDTPELFTVQDRAPDYITAPAAFDGDEEDDFAVEDLESSGLDDGCEDFVVL